MPTERYNWDPEEYARSSSAQQQWGEELIAKLLLTGDEDVLDIGSGDGKLTVQLATHVPRGSVLGIDGSPEMIALARERFPAAKHPNLRFEPGDARELPFDGQFDVVFSNATLHWVLDHGPVLRGIRRALRPGGRMLLQMGGKGNAAGMFAVAEHMLDAPAWRQYFVGFPFPWAFFSADEYRPSLEKAGLAPVRVALIPKTMQYASADGLAAWVRTTWLPYTQRLPESLREEFVSELVANHVAAHPSDSEGRIGVAMVRLEVEAVKSP